VLQHQGGEYQEACLDGLMAKWSRNTCSCKTYQKRKSIKVYEKLNGVSLSEYTDKRDHRECAPEESLVVDDQPRITLGVTAVGRHYT
jgi:hypothetical protein